jgi:hypothetical protein
MYLIPAEDYRHSPICKKRPAAANDAKISTIILSGLSCALSIAKLNYGVMHGLRRSLNI